MLLATAHMEVAVDPARRLLTYRRTPEPFPSIEEVQRAHEALLATLDRAGRVRLAFLCDLRHAPARNDPAFERLLVSYRPRLYAGFRRSATLVTSAVGKLQVSRHMREDGAYVVLVTQDEAAALAYLLEGTEP